MLITTVDEDARFWWRCRGLWTFQRQLPEHIVIIIRSYRLTKKLSSEGDYGETQSELNYLRLQMRAIEVQALEHIESSQDEELTQSIRNWKQQWTEIDQSIKDKRKKCIVETPKKEMPKRIINIG